MDLVRNLPCRDVDKKELHHRRHRHPHHRAFAFNCILHSLKCIKILWLDGWQTSWTFAYWHSLSLSLPLSVSLLPRQPRTIWIVPHCNRLSFVYIFSNCLAVCRFAVYLQISLNISCKCKSICPDFASPCCGCFVCLWQHYVTTCGTISCAKITSHH